MQRENGSLGVSAAVWIGVRVGIVFAACEAITSTWLTRSVVDGLDYQPQSATLCLISFAWQALFGACGGLLGVGIAARLARRIERPAGEVVARIATLALLLALIAQQFSLFPNRPIEVRQSLALASGLAVIVVLSFLGPRISTWLGGLVSPWTPAVALALVPWLSDQPLTDFSWSEKQLWGIAVALGCGLLAILARRALAAPRARSTAVVGAVALFALAGSLIDQSVIDHDDDRPPVAAAGPNVIVLVLDTVRADHLSVYGYKRDTTPFLSEFAKDAVVFERSYSTGDFTLSSHASLFTGKYAIDHGARGDPDRLVSAPLAASATTLAEILVEHGWRTWAVAANFTFLHPRFGLAQGFEHFDARARRIIFSRTPSWTLRGGIHDLLERWLPPHEYDLTYRSAKQINAALLAQLERRKPGEPFFLFGNYLEAHSPYRPPAPFDTRYAPPGPPMDKEEHRLWRERLYSGKQTKLPDALRESYEAQYDGALAYLDTQLGELFQQLKALDLYDSSLIVITADHGEAFGEHASMEHGITAYREQNFVPLLIKRPHEHAGRRETALASGVDLLPTVLSELGLPIPEGLPGRALFGSPAPADRVIFSEHYPSLGSAANNPTRAVHETSAIWNDFVQIRFDNRRMERYDLSNDPHEEHPLDALPPGGPDLDAALEPWLVLPRADRPNDRKQAVESLKMLGYGK